MIQFPRTIYQSVRLSSLLTAKSKSCICLLYTSFSDFKQLTYKNLVTVDGKEWLVMNSIKTGVKLNIPLYLLFNGKALGIMLSLIHIYHNGRYIEIQHRRWNRNYHKQQYSPIKRKLYEDIEVCLLYTSRCV